MDVTWGAVQAMLFTQAFLVSLVVHVSIGVYGCFYVVRSLGGRDGNNLSILTYPGRTSDGDRSISTTYLPETATAMPFLGLVTAGVLGIGAVLLLLVVIVPVALLSETVGRVTIEWFFRPKVVWPTRPTRRYLERRRNDPDR